ncbi:MAG: UDP-glucose/GDP-mannose dehydrogenase family protein [Tannerella sp.]|nr:UDP-glucose/GDP-mannose dehydrogenase family protein [Tannerella sp.]
MRIAIVGTGYVGLVTGTCFAEMGTEVFCIDIDRNKIDKLKKGIIPIYEPGLEELVHKNYKNGRLHFGTDLAEALDNIDVLFSAVGTPPDEDGSADLKYVLDVARTIGRNMKKYVLVVTKSTVPVGTAKKIKQAIIDEQAARGVSIEFDIASNPEFLKEGAAVKDFMNPDRVVVGVETERAQKLMMRLYRPFLLNNFPVIFMDVPSAEMTKYAANAMLATRISFMNEVANLCEIVGADVSMVRKGIGSDNRIGRSFLYAGCGYGGSCFPKDVKALIKTASEHGHDMRILQAVEDVNEQQKHILFRKLSDYYNGELQGKRIAIWGLAFKPETDDMREAPSLVIIDDLLAAGCSVTAYDPVAIDEARRRLGDRIEYADDIYDTTADADALLLVTEWKEFRLPKWTTVKEQMRVPLIIDGRNIYDPAELADLGFEYRCIGGFDKLRYSGH